MNKTITIIELLNKIANGEINNIKFYVKKDDKSTKNNMIIWTVKNNRIIAEESVLKFYRLLDEEIYNLNDTVEIIEEQQDIDIQNIKELPEMITMSDEGYIGRSSFIDLCNKIDMLVRAVKQLDKKLNDK